MDFLRQDVRHALRTLQRARGFTCAAVVTLAIGIGAIAAVFSVIDTVVLRPLPFAQADRLVVLDGAYGPPPMGAPKRALDFTDWQVMRGTFSGLAVVFAGGVNLSSTTGVRRITAAQTTPDLFTLLGARPLLGRAFGSADGTPGHDDVALVSEGLWREQFGGAADILGRTVALDDRSFVIVGVVPDGVAFPARTDVWIPYALPHDRHGDLFFGPMTVLARLRDGVSVQHARAAVDHAERAFAAAHPLPYERNHVGIRELRATLVGDVRAKLEILIGAASLMLLLACANVGGLLLARAEARQHEMAVRTAIGATPQRLLRQLLAEGAVLALCGTIGGLVLAWALRPLLGSLIPKGLAGIASIGVDHRVLLGTIVAGGVSTGLFCLAPALVLARTDVHTLLKARGPRSASTTGRLWQRLVVVQLGVTVVILVAAGLLLKSFWLLQRVDPGFDRHEVLTVHVALPKARYTTDAQLVAYYQAVLARLAEVRGVEAAGVINSLPLTGGTSNFAYNVVGQPPAAERPIAEHLVASPGYFAALRIPIVAGRTFTESDLTSGAAVMVVDELVARRIGSVREAVGAHIRMPWDSTYLVVGVVRTLRDRSLDGTHAPPGQFYLPVTLDPARGMTLVVRGPSHNAQFVRSIRAAIASVDPSIPAFDVGTLEQVASGSLAPMHTVTVLLTIGAALGLILAVVGIFGVIAASVHRRMRELGVRMALGATGSGIARLVLRHALVVATWGIGMGVLCAWGAVRSLAHLLYAVRVTDLSVFVAAALCMGLATIAASAVPVWRASRVDPITALRGD